MSKPKSKEFFSSLSSFVFVATGAAVGLGNIWKFPYMAGQNGGSAFVLCYLFFVFSIAVPVMIAEFFLGIAGRKNPIDSFLELAQKNNRSKLWSGTGYLGLLTLFLIFCFYSVVAGFSIAYLLFSMQNRFANLSPTQIQIIWTDFLASPYLLLSCSFLFIFLTMAVVFFGLKKGIEKSCQIMMPGLLGILGILVIYGLFTGGFSQSVDFLFSFKIEKISQSVLLSSLGHAFFTLAVGACAMMVYGVYLPKRISVFKSVLIISLLDLLVALVAGLAVFPLIFAHGLSPEQGPGLMFVTLPIIFASMPFGAFLGALFFILLFFAALSSSISFAEPLVFLLIDKFGVQRKKASIIIGLLTCMGASLCGLSLNVLSGVKIFGKLSIFDFIADLSTNVLLPFGAILICIFATRVIKKDDVLENADKKDQLYFKIWRMLTSYFVPIGILIILFNGFLELFS